MNTVDGVNACDLDKLLVDIKRMKNIGKRDRQLENYSLKKQYLVAMQAILY